MTQEEYKAVLGRGCAWEKSGGEDTDGDCGHGYEWDCDRCPIIIEEHREKSAEKEVE